MKLSIASIVVLLSTGAFACSGDLKVSSTGDLDAIKGCSTYQGSITIDHTALSMVNLQGIQMLKGDLTVTNNDGLLSLSLPKAQAIDGQFKLENNKALSKLDMGSLTALRSFHAAVLPALSAISFPAGLVQVSELTISDTTATRVDGLKMSKISQFVVDNNIYLKSIGISNTTEIQNKLTVSANSPSLNLDLSSIQSIKDGSFRNLAGVSLGQLQKVTGDISFISNTFSSLELAKVDEVAGTLTISNNMNLNNVSMPVLRHLGGALSVTNNTELATVHAFPSLEEVDGTLDITGTFDEVDFPKLNDIRGGLNVQTSSSLFQCSDMTKLKNGVLKGNAFTCKSSVAKPKSGIMGKGADGKSGGFGSDASGATGLSATTVSWVMMGAGVLASVWMA